LYVIDNGKVDTPRFSPGSGRYPAAHLVTITSETPGAVIHYTTDGHEPTEADATIASGSTILVAQDLLLRARAWKTDVPASDIGYVGYSFRGGVAAGGAHSVAVKGDGTVWTWGYNPYRELGDPAFTDTYRVTPAQVPDISDVVAVAAGDSHTVALKRDGTV